MLMNSRLQQIAVFAFSFGAFGLCAAGSLTAAEQVAYVFTYFVQNGQDGLHLAWSRDGYKWEALNEGRPYLSPAVGREKLIRDPCVVKGPDGVYHMVWTCGWHEKSFGYASTRDFIIWTPQRAIPAMEHEPTARNAWAPEIVHDTKTGEYTIFWATTIPGRFPATQATAENDLNHRIYATTTKDFATFTPTRLFCDPGFNCIDATFLRDGDRQWMVIKDETRFPEPKKHLRIAMAKSLNGPFGELSAPITPPGEWVEGATAIRIGDDYLIYYDAYVAKHYGMLRSGDLKNWENVTAKASFPNEGTKQRMRHGTVLEVPMSLVDKLRTDKVSAEIPAPAPEITR
ncbi:MAG TPA: glycoside hydrolase family 43 protein [Luteolibacter sp.]|nr:glycoside hydrolase family 43 protein [Luteolibacter sp.]